MFDEGTILYFKPFYFKNGKSTPKPKYFVVLKKDKDTGILASLPTRKDSIPKDEMIDYGCVELPEIRFNCFVFPKGVQVTDSGKCFDFPTHIYGHQIEFFEEKLLKEIYPLEGVDYEVWGKMKENVFVDLIDCLKNSSMVKSKFVRILNLDK